MKKREKEKTFGSIFWTREEIQSFRDNWAQNVKIIVSVRPRSAKRFKKMCLCSFVAAFWCLRVPPDVYFVDLGSDLGWILDVFWKSFFAYQNWQKTLRSIV